MNIVKCSTDSPPDSSSYTLSSYKTKSRDRLSPLTFDSESNTPTHGSLFSQRWRKFVRVGLTTALYIAITQCYYLMDTPIVVYTCSDGRENGAPRVVLPVQSIQAAYRPQVFGALQSRDFQR